MASLRAQEQRRVWALPLPLFHPSPQPRDQSSLRRLPLVPPRLLLMPPLLRPVRHPLMPLAQPSLKPQVQTLRLHLPPPAVLVLLRPLPRSPLQPPFLLAHRPLVLHLPRLFLLVPFILTRPLDRCPLFDFGPFSGYTIVVFVRGLTG